jgi:hypothetical protein
MVNVERCYIRKSGGKTAALHMGMLQLALEARAR